MFALYSAEHLFLLKFLKSNLRISGVHVHDLLPLRRVELIKLFLRIWKPNEKDVEERRRVQRPAAKWLPQWRWGSQYIHHAEGSTPNTSQGSAACIGWTPEYPRGRAGLNGITRMILGGWWTMEIKFCMDINSWFVSHNADAWCVQGNKPVSQEGLTDKSTSSSGHSCRHLPEPGKGNWMRPSSVSPFPRSFTFTHLPLLQHRSSLPQFYQSLALFFPTWGLAGVYMGLDSLP